MDTWPNHFALIPIEFNQNIGILYQTTDIGKYRIYYIFYKHNWIFVGFIQNQRIAVFQLTCPGNHCTIFIQRKACKTTRNQSIFLFFSIEVIMRIPYLPVTRIELPEY